MVVSEDDFRNKKNLLERLEGLLRRIRDIRQDTMMRFEELDMDLLKAEQGLDSLEEFVETCEHVEADEEELADEEE